MYPVVPQWKSRTWRGNLVAVIKHSYLVQQKHCENWVDSVSVTKSSLRWRVMKTEVPWIIFIKSLFSKPFLNAPCIVCNSQEPRLFFLISFRKHSFIKFQTNHGYLKSLLLSNYFDNAHVNLVGWHNPENDYHKIWCLKYLISETKK